ncbi:precorrin-8X methylmutase [Acidithrix ferrooxidans]|uniref:Precorrin-8X methylmutase n=1 Tax=Acidithrix ferrooxidans TaxID=1280514 RepID=A0A0D8HLY2_9ACTN|nr:precorrin-8X methylmutase [Acidithrix ferrooxidans]KJF18111.1 precorrin-8X methylmutase [Acidithrix ferrooxidans]
MKSSLDLTLFKELDRCHRNSLSISPKAKIKVINNAQSPSNIVIEVKSINRYLQQMAGNDIEDKSMAIIAQSVNLNGFDRYEREVAARVIHACADPTILETLSFSDGSVAKAVNCLANSRAKVITDVEMTRRALYWRETICGLDQVETPDQNKTRTQTGIENALLESPSDPIVVIGCAPTALYSVIELWEKERIDPTLVVALPVGFVGAAEAKKLLQESEIPQISNIGPRGGSAMTAAAFNAIARMAKGSFVLEEALNRITPKANETRRPK